VPSAALQCTIIFTFISPNSADIRGLVPVKTGLGQQDGDNIHNFYAGSGDAGRINRHQILRDGLLLAPRFPLRRPRPHARPFPMSPTLSSHMPHTSLNPAQPSRGRGTRPQTRAPHVNYCPPCPRPQQPQPLQSLTHSTSTPTWCSHRRRTPRNIPAPPRNARMRRTPSASCMARLRRLRVRRVSHNSSSSSHRISSPRPETRSAPAVAAGAGIAACGTGIRIP
jgi:hypothetical protein